MTDQSRVWKVLVMLLVSMTVGTIVLMSLGNTPPGSGAFSLASYYQLGPLAEAIASHGAQQHPDRWEQIEIVCSGTRTGNINTLASGDAELNAHFVVCNGQDRGVVDGKIQTTKRWHMQQSTQPQMNLGNPRNTITIVLVARGHATATPPTEYQLMQARALASKLGDLFRIDPNDIRWLDPA